MDAATPLPRLFRTPMAMRLRDELQRGESDGETGLVCDAAIGAAGDLGSPAQSGLFGFADPRAAAPAVAALFGHQSLSKPARRGIQRPLV